MPGWCVFAGNDSSNSVHHVRAHDGNNKSLPAKVDVRADIRLLRLGAKGDVVQGLHKVNGSQTGTFGFTGWVSR